MVSGGADEVTEGKRAGETDAARAAETNGERAGETNGERTGERTGERAGETNGESAGQTAIHGLILLGSDPVYAVHMPLFTPPHDFQAVARVTLSTDTYHRARARYGTSALFTVRPRGPAAGADIPGDLFFGHFARDGDLLGEVTVRVRQRVWTRRLQTDPAPQPALKYVVFGTDQLFLAHRLPGPPDFDQLLTAQFTGEPADQGTTVRLPGRPNDLTGRLRPGEQITTAEGIGLQVLAEVYLETEDLTTSI